MLLRSSSAPILKSWLPQCCSRESSPEPESQLHKRTKSVSMSIDDNTRKLIHHSLTELNVHKDTTKPRNSTPNHNNNNNNNKALMNIPRSKPRSNDEDPHVKTSTFSVERLLWNNGLGEKVEEEGRDDVEVGGGGGMGSDDGVKISNGSDGGGGGGGTDAYYRRMIETNPGNSLFLGNYAKFLKEVKGELEKAQEYCERAILANPDDANILSLYAHLIWQIHKDRRRAQNYFDQAVKSAPHDCYVQASYARFLWDVEEDEADNEFDEEEEEEDDAKADEETQKRPHEIGHFSPNFFHGAPQHPPITAGS